MQKIYFLYEPGAPRLRYVFRSVSDGFHVKKAIGEAGELIRSLDLRPHNGDPVDTKDWEQGLHNYHGRTAMEVRNVCP